MSAAQIAAVALETWRASGEKSTARLAALASRFADSYGRDDKGSAEVVAVAMAGRFAWEL